MAFLSKVGRIFSQTSSHVTASLQSIRCMSSSKSKFSSKVFVGGISYNTDELGLREAFSKYGQVVDAKIVVDRETGKSRGFGFVTFTSNKEATNAINMINTQYLHGRRLTVYYATERGSPSGGRYSRRGSFISLGAKFTFFPARGYRGGSSYGGFDDKFSSNEPLGNDTDHQLESAVDEQFGGSDNQFGGSEKGQTEVGPDGFDQTDDVAKRA
ncbi:glycine-rich RNA-binding protein 5, mitochondrial-like [Raphanus sativus]|uniref:Glycine-rich RNA-binding protein 5, mitochondrial-like n=1 Tax=Raphanus sativus TaxID=3726 RepID=A0A6J0M5X6_RAPSA|nr:glycine-rich RNA-binding protein 5, mitochondrial-like [Raphanus sativus]XP_018467860.2 glycine-rich RNA-binding protein 5, mitochondrial-like [Raphanus sativus]